MTNLRDKQPAINVPLDGKIHTLSITDIRILANEKSESVLVRCLCRAVLDLIEDEE